MKRAGVASLLLLTMAGCVTPQAGLCSIRASREDMLAPSPDIWNNLVLHGFDPQARQFPQPASDCMGVPVMWQEPRADECREPGPAPEPLPPRDTLEDGDTIVEILKPGLRLVWILTRRYSNGEALGPVALVENVHEGYEVRVLGSLRSFSRQARLRLQHVGNWDVLHAEGDQCTEETPPTCRRMARLLPIRQGRFISEPILSSEGKCLGPGWIPLSREQTFELPNGRHRRMEQTTTLGFDKDRVTLHEQVEVTDSDPRQPALPPKLYRRAEAERAISFEKARTVGTAPSLWQRLLEFQVAVGAKALDDKSTPKSDGVANTASAPPPLLARPPPP